MSMSQEEIESLMNGLDFGGDDNSTEEQELPQEDLSEKSEAVEEKVSEDDINNLISQTENMINQENNSKEESDEIIETSQDEVLTNIDNNINIEIENNTEDDAEDSKKDIETTSDEEKEEVLNQSDNNQEVSSQEIDNIDDILANIEGIEETSSPNEVKNEDVENKKDIDEEDIDHKINSGVFPLPVEQDTKVVNQLSQVANDSEEKATKIFDVLSNILDYNNEIQNDVKELAQFNEKQNSMLASLNNKFPNIEAFKQNLEQSQKMGDFISDINDKLENGNMEIFQAMELMQYHDINRQKIERVMAVIRKLSIYLNNLFEDEGSHKEIAVAKHIHGDKTTGDLVGDDDLEALIEEFNK